MARDAILPELEATSEVAYVGEVKVGLLVGLLGHRWTMLFRRSLSQVEGGLRARVEAAEQRVLWA